MYKLTDDDQRWLAVSAHEWTEDTLITAIQQHVERPVDIVADVGANMGMSVMFLHHFLRPKKIYAVEPGLHQLKIFKTITAEIPKDILSLHECGVYYGKTETTLLLSPDGNSGGDSLEAIAGKVMDYEDRERSEYTIKLKTLEDLFDTTPGFLKMDVEGAEYNIVENSTMIHDIPTLLIEWHHKRNTRGFVSGFLPNHEIVYINDRSCTLLKKVR